MIFFVGMHNKPGMEPLDSRTYSGKIIDQVIERIGSAEKTNLSDTYSIPENPYSKALTWHYRHNPQPGDTVILLGKWVQKYFAPFPGLKVVNAPHPASFKVRGRISDYIDEIESNFK